MTWTFEEDEHNRTLVTVRAENVPEGIWSFSLNYVGQKIKKLGFRVVTELFFKLYGAEPHTP